MTQVFQSIVNIPTETTINVKLHEVVHSFLCVNLIKNGFSEYIKKR